MRALRRSPPRGQTTALFAATCALLAFGAVYLIAFADVLRNKTDAQATADAAAYSAAVAQARAFNYFGYTNRSLIARYAATLSLEAYQNYMAYYDESLYRTYQFLDGQGQALEELGAFGLPVCDVWRQSCDRRGCRQVCAKFRFVDSCRSKGDRIRTAVNGASQRFQALHEQVHTTLEQDVIPAIERAGNGLDQQGAPAALGHLRQAEIVRGFQRDVWLDLTGLDVRIDIENQVRNGRRVAPVSLMGGQTLVGRIATGYRPDAVFPVFNSGPRNPSTNDPGYRELLNAVIEEPYWAEIFFDAVLATRNPTWPGARAQGLEVFSATEAPELTGAIEQTRQDFGALGGGFELAVTNEGGSHYVFHADPRATSPNGPRDLTARRPEHRWAPDLSSKVGGYMGLTALDRGELSVDASFECTRTGEARDLQHLRQVQALETSYYGEPESHGHSFLKLGEPGDHPPHPMLVGWALQRGMPGGMDGVASTQVDTNLNLGAGNCGNTILGCGLWVGFMRYRPSLPGEGLSTRANNMPHSFAVLGMPSRLPPLGPWRSGSFEALVGVGDAPQRYDASVPTAWASSAGLTYYHPPRAGAPDAWEEPPSLFNPFWRAKLQRLTPGNAAALMSAAQSSTRQPPGGRQPFDDSATILVGVARGGPPNFRQHPFAR